VPRERLTGSVAGRLSHYLHVLTQAKKAGRDSISSQELADYTSVNATQIRRDLSGFGKFGRRGVGYSVDLLSAELRRILGAHSRRDLALVGAGRLGEAIATSDVFVDHGFHVGAVFDADDDRVGGQCGPHVVSAMSELQPYLRQNGVLIGLVAVPGEAAQEVCDALVEGGVRVVVDYSGALLDAPANVLVHNASPAAELLRALYLAGQT
jgi:redox-sensing transcriptional repressor